MAFLEAWLAQKAMKKTREHLRAELAEDDTTSLLELAPAQGARWLHRPDGSWARWSYLGASWEAATPPVIPPIESRNVPSSPVEWIEHSVGRWERVEPAGVLNQAEDPAPEPSAPALPLADVEAEDPDIDIGDPPAAGDWSGAAFVTKNVAVACAYTVPISLVAYFVVWATSLVANIFTSLMSPWLFDKPTPILPLTMGALAWILVFAVPVGLFTGLVRSMTRSE